MGGKPRMRQWIVWLDNLTDCRDDTAVRVLAKTAEDARESVKHSNRFVVGGVYTVPDFHKVYPDWKGLV